jgi:radical SAM protein with 4Fe4S-binding SPASM domain
MFSKFKAFLEKSTYKNPNSIDRESKVSYNSVRPQTKHNSFCFAPSVNMYFSWEGKVIACCFNQKYELGRYPEQSLKEIWNSDAAQNLRKSLKEYDLTKGCDDCYADIYHSRFPSVNALRFDEYEVGKFPRMMEFQLTNTCNLQCIMCSGYLSSSIRKHREKLPELPMKYDEDFVTQITEFLPNLEYTTFSGGEPFMIDIYYDIWDKLVELNPDCIIKVITNGTILNSRVKALLDKGNFHITISLDSPLKGNYEKIRVGASFDKVIENAQYFSEYCQKQGTNFNLNFCPMVSNWQELPEFVNLCNSLNASLYFSIVYDPWYYSLSKLKKEELDFIYETLSARIEQMSLPSNDNLIKFKLLLKKIQKWALESNKPIKYKEVSLKDVQELIFKKISTVSNQYSQDDLTLVQFKVKEVIKGFENNPIHEYLYYNMVEKSTPLAMFTAILSKDTEDMVAEGVRNFNKKIPLPKIDII